MLEGPHRLVACRDWPRPTRALRVTPRWVRVAWCRRASARASNGCRRRELIDRSGLTGKEGRLSAQTWERTRGGGADTTLCHTTDTRNRRRIVAPGAGRERPNTGRWSIRRWQVLGFNQYGDNSTSAQAECAMSENLEDSANCTRVAGERNPSVVISREDVIQQLQLSLLVRAIGLGSHTVPELIILVEAALELVRWVVLLDVSLVRSVIAGVDRDALTQELLDGWNERVPPWQ